MTRTIVATIFGALAALPMGWLYSRSVQPISPQAFTVKSATTPAAVSIPQNKQNKPKPFGTLKGTPGYWRLAETQDGVWWYVSPQNKREFLNTVTTVQPYQAAKDISSPAYVSSDYDGGTSPSGDLHHWAESTLARIRASGFKGLGAWCNPVFHEYAIPMTRDLNLSQWVHGAHPGDPAWAAAIDDAVKAQVVPLRNNKNLVGYFIDNELDWSHAASIAEEYFRVTTTAIRKYDPNHLILGVRFKGVAPIEIVRASRNYTDAQSLNYYVGDAQLDPDMFAMMYRESGQPIIISEYSFHSLDGRSGNRNTVGFSAQVVDQAARGQAYHLFTTRLSRVPYFIGADWFQWNDEPTNGRLQDGEDVNFGVMDVDDRAYEQLVSAVKQTTPLLNPLHDRSSSDDGEGIYRERYEKVSANVPYLSQPVRINGELSDWPATAKLPQIHRFKTVGTEHESLPLPNVYLGWRDDGLYVAMEVFDRNIQTLPADAWWWTRDSAEFWVATQPIAPTQETYSPFCHQFFIVPSETGTVGQWHRPGDGLSGNLIPHPAIQHSLRILSDRYVIEMFVPAKALNGWDPRHQSTLAFNFHARDFQTALDYFWSAPKEQRTEQRPSTWGTIRLIPPDQIKTPAAH